MLKSTILFIGLLTEVSHLNPEFTQPELKEIASYMAEEPEFKANPEIVEFINDELSNMKPAMLHCRKVAYNLGMRPEGANHVSRRTA